MNSSVQKTRKLGMVLLTGFCVAASGLYAADNSTNTTQKPASHPAVSTAHSTTTHPVAKKTGTPTTTSHPATNRTATPHPSSAQTATKKPIPHTSTTSAANRTPNRTTASASQHKASAAHSRYSANRRVTTLNGWQRLARLRLQPERVEEIQQALIREGYLQGDANGQWDSRTHDAMLRYQTDHGFPATGLPEAKSLMKLGLGSHPLPPELDHGPAGNPSRGAAQGVFTVTPTTPPVSQATPPS